MRRVLASAKNSMKRLLLALLFPLMLFGQGQNFPGSTGAAANSPLPPATSGPGPVFNVKNYGAKGDTQKSVNGTASNSQLTCTDCNFSAATDTGKAISCAIPNVAGNVTAVANNTTISSVVNATTVNLSQVSAANSTCTVTWGTIDNVAIAAAVTAWLNSAKTLLIGPAAPILYFPAGRYSMTQGITVDFSPNAKAVLVMQGDGSNNSVIHVLTGSSATNGFLYQTGTNTMQIKGMTWDGGSGIQTDAFNTALLLNGSVTMNDVSVVGFNIGGIQIGSTNSALYNLFVANNNGIGMDCEACAGEWRQVNSSNNGNSLNLQINKVIGLNANAGLKIYGGLIDECGSSAVCTEVQNSNDVWFIGSSLFGTVSGFAFAAFQNSFVHFDGGIVGVFGTDTNVSGAEALDRSVIQASDTRFVSSGTGKCFTDTGTFQDNGGNTCESMFQIASGTSTGTTAVLTLTNAGAAVNTNCSVGDALLVEGSLIAGYNGYYPAGATTGITATSSTTLTYTTTGSNLGALSAGGVAFCRNLQTFTGNLPRALLNNPIPNTCYYTITPIANATTVTLCNFSTGNATNITRVRASSQVTTTCATPPLITISDGTVSQTLTLTSGKNSWDSSVDTSTGVGTTIFKPNGTITVKYDVAANSACATPATNLSVSYNIAPILSN